MARFSTLPAGTSSRPWPAPLRWIGSAAAAAVAVASLAVIAGGLLQRPILLGAIPSDSMVPALNRGDMAVIIPSLVVPEPPVGTVVVFRTGRTPWIVHRIVAGDAAAGYVTQGDANQFPDPERVFPRDIVGVVPAAGDGLLHLPGFGRLVPQLEALRHPAALGGLLALALILLVSERPGLLGRPRPGRPPRPSLRRPALAGAHAAAARVPGGAPLAVYAGLAATVWLVVALQGLLTASDVAGRFAVVAASKDGLLAGQVLHGAERVETLRLENPFPVPVAVVLTPRAEGVGARPDRLVVPPRGAAEYRLAISGERALGEHPFRVRRAFYLPVLPLDALAALEAWGSPAAAAGVALVPACAVLLLASCDPAARLAARLWLLRVRLSVPRRRQLPGGAAPLALRLP